MKLLLALLGAVVLYSGYRIWQHELELREDPIAEAIKRNNKERDRRYPLGDTTHAAFLQQERSPNRDEFSGWDEEVDRIYRDGQA